MKLRSVGLAAAGIAALGVAGVAAGPEKTVARYRDFEKTPAGWTTWTPRPEIAPRFAVDPGAGRNGRGALRIDGAGNAAAVGSWRRTVDGIAPGRTYRFTAYYRTEGVDHAAQRVSARLIWLDSAGKQARPPDYTLDGESDGAWKKVEHVAAAPDSASSVQIELTLVWSPKGRVWWDDVRLDEEQSPRQRVVRMAAVYHRPSGTGSREASVEQFCRVIEGASSQRPDFVCLPEGITVIGTGKSYADVSEPVPGPTTARLATLARKMRCYIVAGLYERVGDVVYNTAVLIDRKGELTGKYRKTHLPREEVEAGITPGDTYPVFDTEFGKVGLLICWDLQFPEPARAMAVQGAEILLLPIWGGSEVLAQARAIENHCFMVTSSYDMKTFIVDPSGKVLAEATKQHPVAVAELQLDRKIIQPWLGDMKARTWKERRADLRVP